MMGKLLLETYSGLQVAWIRYFGAFLAYVLVAGATLALDRRARWNDFFLVPTNLRTWLELLALGIGPFVYSPILQFVGLETAQAMDNSILIATEPLITVLLAWVVLGERMNRDHVLSISVVLVGFSMFAGFYGGGPGFTLSIGMLLLLLSLLGEASFSVFGRKLVLIYAPSAVLGSALAIGALALTLIVAGFDRLPSLRLASPAQLGAAVWLGPIGSTLTYLIWARIARTVTVPTMVITLFVQPVVGAAVGYLILGERLTLDRFIGAVVILGGIAYLSFREIRRGPVM